MLSVVMSYVSPDTVFAFLVNSYGTVAIFVYVLIALSRSCACARSWNARRRRNCKVRMWCYPYLTYVAIFGMLGIVTGMAFIPEQRMPLALGVASLAILLLAFISRSIWRRIKGLPAVVPANS